MNRVATSVASAVGTRSLSTMPGGLYRTVFKRNSTYTAYIVFGVIVLEAAYVTATDALWNSWNKGVRACVSGRLLGPPLLLP